MTLNESEAELIRASWKPARRDSVGAGILLFKGLFTKFPDYLRLFNQFVDLDTERLHENKRLVKHAVKVIETVTFVVDSIGDPAKGEQLTEALVALVRGHLKRNIGLDEFRNLGIVLIDFICDLNNRRAGRITAHTCKDASLSNNNNNTIIGGKNPSLRGVNSSTSSSQDSETMTSTLDKIRASSSPSSSSEDESLLARTSATMLEEGDRESGISSSHYEMSESHLECGNQCAGGLRNEDETGEDEDEEERGTQRAKLDASLLVAAWTKLYGVILDLVKSEAARAGQ